MGGVPRWGEGKGALNSWMIMTDLVTEPSSPRPSQPAHRKRRGAQQASTKRTSQTAFFVTTCPAYGAASCSAGFPSVCQARGWRCDLDLQIFRLRTSVPLVSYCARWSAAGSKGVEFFLAQQL